MEVLASFELKETYFKQKKYLDCLARFWEFDISNTGLLTSDIFKMFIEKLTKCTSRAILCFSNKQLITVSYKIFLVNFVLKFRCFVTY